MLTITGKSFSEALILASVNQQNEKRLFIEFPRKIQVYRGIQGTISRHIVG